MSDAETPQPEASVAAPVTVTTPAQHPAFIFTGRQGELAKLSVKITLLTLLTIGIYRFWGKTHLRKYFWNNVTIAGDPLEYIGTPGELFKGFLIALVVLAPTGFLYNALATAVMADGFAMQMTVEGAYYFMILILVQIAFYRMWRYRLSRTTWRGIRFHLMGSTMVYLWRALGWSLAFFLTLGFSHTWGRVALWRYRLNHTGFGSQSFAFDGSGRDLVKYWAVTFYIPVALIFLYSAFDPTLAKLGTLYETGGEITDDDIEGILRAFGLMAIIGALWMFVLIWYQVREFKYVVENLQFGDIHFNLDLSVATVIGLYVKFLTVVGVTFGLGYLMFLSDGIVVGGIIIVTGFLVVMPLANTVIVDHGLAKAITSGLVASDIQAFENVMRSVNEAPKTGEGLADALDVGAF